MINFPSSLFPHLTTERLQLNRLSETDLPELFVHRSDPKNMNFIHRDPASNADDIKALFDKINNSYNEQEGIAWAIRSGDLESFRKAVQMSYALWGGRFNPIVVVDDDEAKHLVEGFRADLVVPVGDSEPVKRFGETFSHLISPFFGDIFLDKHNGQGRAQVLDVHNAMMHLINTPRWEIEKKRGFRKYKWASEDPLADILLCLLGLYPQEEVGIDYTRIFLESTEATITPIDPALPLPNDLVEHPTISSLCRFGITRDHTVRGGWDSPGFFIGDASNLRDLVSFWNLRAADISLCFVDHRYPERFSNLIPAWEKVFNDAMSSRSYGFNRGLVV